MAFWTHEFDELAVPMHIFAYANPPPQLNKARAIRKLRLPVDLENVFIGPAQLDYFQAADLSHGQGMFSGPLGTALP